MRPEATPFAHAVLMPAVRHLHGLGYEGVYLWSAFSPSGTSLRWHVSVGPQQGALFMRPRHEPLRLDEQVPCGNQSSLHEGLGLTSGDALDAASIAARLLHIAGKQRAQRAQAPNAGYVAWFAHVCDALLPDYTFYLSADWMQGAPAHLPVTAMKPHAMPHSGKHLNWPLGYQASTF